MDTHTLEEEKKVALDIFNTIKGLDNGPSNEAMSILADAINSYNNSTYFSSISVITMFLEKYLRDTLIRYERENSGKRQEEEYLDYLTEIENEIEDGRIYNFHGICESLYTKNIININYFNALNDIYKDLRIPVHHGIYQRLIKKQIVPQNIKGMKFSFSSGSTDDQKVKEFWNALDKASDETNYNYEFENYHPITRSFILPNLLKKRSLELFIFSKDLIKYITKN